MVSFLIAVVVSAILFFIIARWVFRINEIAKLLNDNYEISAIQVKQLNKIAALSHLSSINAFDESVIIALTSKESGAVRTVSVQEWLDGYPSISDNYHVVILKKEKPTE